MIQRAIDVRACRTHDEMMRAAGAISHYFGKQPDAVWVERWLNFFELERMHAAFDGDAIVGGAGAFSLELTVPGGSVKAGGVSVVGVLPTHRRRGALTALVRAQLDDIRRRGEPIACLWASEETIYGRFGYGAAVMSLEMSVPRERSAYRAPFTAQGAARLVSIDEAVELLPGVYDRVRTRTPGMLSRSPGWWRYRRLLDLPERRGGGGLLQCMVLELDGRPEAYAVYRMHFALEHGSGASTLDVLEAIGTTPEATASIWRILLDIDWTSAVKAQVVATDHPLRLLLAEPRRASFRLYDTLWVRLVDVEAALAARSFAGSGSIVLEVRDGFCDWNAGRWEIGGGGSGRGTVKRTDANADLAIDASELASVYLGGFSFRDLAEAGRIVEPRAGAIERADALFRTERAPWNAEMF